MDIVSSMLIIFFVVFVLKVISKNKKEAKKPMSVKIPLVVISAVIKSRIMYLGKVCILLEGEVMKMKKCKHVFIYDKFGKGHCIYCLKADESSRKLYFCHECNKKHSKEGKC